MNIQKWSFFLVVLICISCTNDEENTVAIPVPEAFYFPPNGSDVWETKSISDLNWNVAAVDDLKNFLNSSNTQAFMVLVNGRIVIEEYFNSATSTTLIPWFSASKTLTSFTVGLAQQDGFITINDLSSDYLGSGWTNMPVNKESLITIKHQLTMSSGGDYTTGDTNCTDPICLNYLADAGTEWYYYNAFYTMIQPALDGAISGGFSNYFNTNLKNVIGMTGLWYQTPNYNKYYVGNARSMARFGLLNLNKGTWNGNELLNEAYFNEMTTTSQDLNKSYGYLYWLNGKESYRAPGSTQLYPGKLIPNAPDDLFAGLGANDKKMYIIPSLNMVVIRLGGAAGTSLLGPSGYDNLLWEKINAVIN
ncbi:MAG: serine hydrolase [Flavobacteriaceae bacterium]